MNHLLPAVVVACALGGLTACSPDPSFDDGSSSTGSAAPTGATTGGTDTGSGGASSTSGATSTTSGGDGGAGVSASVSASTSTASTVTVGSGATCTTAADCVDDNPCTTDTCDPDGCHNVGVAAGTAGNPAEGGCVGVCQIDATCGLQVYSHPFGAGGQATWARTTVSEMFGVGADRPPAAGIVEVTYLQAIGALAIYASDGVVYVRVADGSWLPATAIDTLLPGMPGPPICGFAYQPDGAVPTSSLTLAVDGDPLEQAYLYTVDGDGVIIADPGNPYPVDRTDEAGSPPPNADPCAWSFGVQTSFPPTASWVVLWNQVGPNVYLLDGGTLEWTNYGAAAGSPVYAAGGTGPDPAAVVAAWWADGTAYFVAP